MVHALPLSYVVIHTENNKLKKKVREEGSFLAQSYRDGLEVQTLKNRGSLPTHISQAARNPDMSQAVSRLTQQHAASVSQLCCKPTYLCPFLVPALHLDSGDGCKHLICWQVLGQPGQKLGTVDEVHPRQDILE